MWQSVEVGTTLLRNSSSIVNTNDVMLMIGGMTDIKSKKSTNKIYRSEDGIN